MLKGHPSGLYTEGRIYYRGPRNTPTVGSVKLDLSQSERVARPPVRRPISHPYTDCLPAGASIRCYAFEEVYAEKIRAMGERGRPRDLYNIVAIFRRTGMGLERDIVRSVLLDKCRTKGVTPPTFESVSAAVTRGELVAEWSSMLGHQLPALPPFDTYWREVEDLFRWLGGSTPRPTLPDLPHNNQELPAADWSPPATIQVWEAGVPLERIRFAGANHLCVRITSSEGRNWWSPMP